MTGGFVALLILGLALRGAADEQVGVASATARTVYESSSSSTYEPNNVLDGNTDTFYHSDTSNQEQWLKLDLTEPQDVAKVIIINRYQLISQ